MKDIFCLRKTRLKGLRKNSNLLCAAFALADLCLLNWAGRREPVPARRAEKRPPEGS